MITESAYKIYKSIKEYSIKTKYDSLKIEQDIKRLISI